MRKSRFSEEQIIGILKLAEAGVAVSELCRQNAISDATFYKWQSKFGGVDAVGSPSPAGVSIHAPRWGDRHKQVKRLRPSTVTQSNIGVAV